MALLLFDIDGTLIRPRGLGRKAFEQACRDLYGLCPASGRFRFDGLLDTHIAAKQLQLLGKESGESAVARLLEAYVARLKEERAGPKEDHLCPGVPGILDSAVARGHFLGLLTGNILEGAKVKLGLFDLWEYFPAGAFGADAPDRPSLVAVASARCSSAFNRRFQAHETWIIGDSIHDITAAKAGGVRSVAVATGHTPAARLAALEPDLLLDDLTAPRLLWEFVEEEALSRKGPESRHA
ncbi:MAG: HAD hydrolase-like protein [Acidobacteriota bacterium]|jgi:phosphoglycolate phosphatase